MLSPSQEQALKIALRAAGQILLQFYQTELIKNHKPDGSFATQADIASEQFLITELKKILPEASVCAEESGIQESMPAATTANLTPEEQAHNTETPAYQHNNQNKYQWVIDPLDGTTNFANKIPYFCISVALTQNNRPVVGCIYNPITDELFYAQKNLGAFCNDTQIKISDKENSQDSTICVEFAVSDLPLLASVWFKVSSTRSYGASALDIAYCAAGRFDGVILTQFRWWDIAAGIILIQEAMGVCISFDRNINILGNSGTNKPDLNSKSFICGNRLLVDQYYKFIKQSY